MENINITYAGFEGLIDRIVLEVVDDFRSVLHKWKKNIIADKYEKYNYSLICNMPLTRRMWEDLTWFLGDDLDILYPNENIDGYKIYTGLLNEWKAVQKELDCHVNKPKWVESMEEAYESEKSNS